MLHNASSSPTGFISSQKDKETGSRPSSRGGSPALERSTTGSMASFTCTRARSGRSSRPGSPLFRGIPAGSRGGIRVEPAISPVLLHHIVNSDVARHLNTAEAPSRAMQGSLSPCEMYSCEKDELRPEDARKPAISMKRQDELDYTPHVRPDAAQTTSRGEGGKVRRASPLYGCSSTEGLALQTGSPGRARAAADIYAHARSGASLGCSEVTAGCLSA